MKEKYQETELECILCGRGFYIDEVFICHVKPDDTITICQCLNHPECVSDQKEKVGGWAVVQRKLSGYIIPNLESNE